MLSSKIFSYKNPLFNKNTLSFVTRNFFGTDFSDGIDKKNIITLTDSEKTQLQKTFSKIEYDPRGSADYILKLRKEAYNNFPTRLLKLLESQKAGLDIKPYIIVNNLPFDKATGSPRINESSLDFKPTHLSENLIVAFSAIVGEPYSILFEGSEIVNNLVPHKEHEKEYTGLGSGVELDFHIENAALKYSKDGNMSPTGLTLNGVKYDELANPTPKTRICDSRLALDGLKDYEKEVLKGNNYKIKVPMRWRTSTNQITEPSPIIKGCSKQPEVAVAFYPDMVKPISKEASDVLDKFYSNVKEKSEWVDIKPGTMVYTDNRFTMHSRDKFTASYDEDGRGNRWVQRVFTKDSLWPYRNIKQEKDRVLNPTEPKSDKKIGGGSVER